MSDSDEEEALVDYRNKCNEVVELQQELQAAKLELQQLRLRWQAVSKRTALPVHLPATIPPTEDRRVSEFRTIFQWIMQHLETCDREVIDVGFKVPICGKTICMRRVVQWPLLVQARKLKLSVPVEHKDEIEAVLTVMRAEGAVDAAILRHLVTVWDLITGELMLHPHGCAEPAILLEHRVSGEAILIATWPTREALEQFSTAFAATGFVPNSGSRVKILYNGNWFQGTLHSVDSRGKVAVHCDGDTPGILTVVPVNRIGSLS